MQAERELRNYVEVIGPDGQVLAIYDYGSGQYDNGLPPGAYLMHLRFYKDSQLVSDSNA